ncbi:hypothetical protein GCM10027429_25550 [Marivirga atlantica]|jgi:uncharacterized membrane protein|uniref:DUF1211 domain-containing protein n=1 Tax=Marivirga atlantica TaxID=1548457 RepID=A0A937AC78_9BACT|nr:TMEM175 family protein [Marivirga atlantica]MBL0766155.1 DUF1211 domain-containing protein [Marivirga atlantica]
MIRKAVKKSHGGLNPEFRYRGEEQTRIETFSDAVFALAVTLMVLSSTVPNTFADLQKSLADVVPFGICIVLLSVIWFQHYIFFIRYGFRDVKIVAINTILLFLVLIYVYPLKFLFKFLFGMYSALLTDDRETFNYLNTEVINSSEMSSLLFIYGIGAMLIFLVLAWMYALANSRRRAIGLNTVEVFLTRTGIYNNLLMAAVPFISCIITLIPFSNQFSKVIIAGFSYWLYPVLLPTFHAIRNKRYKKLLLNI